LIAQLRRTRPVEELASPAHDLHCDIFRRRRANRLSFGKRTSNVEHLYNVDIEQWRECFHFRDRNLVERNLVVPTAGRVQFGARGADSFRKRGFDIHVHVFKRSISFKLAGLDLLLDRAQFALDFLPFIDGL
jgi:hypothetical protein